MSTSLSKECKKRIKELEEKLLWAKNFDFPYAIFPDLIVFLAVSCRFAGRGMDQSCKKVMEGYEADILDLNLRTTSEKISGLETVLSKAKTHAMQ